MALHEAWIGAEIARRGEAVAVHQQHPPGRPRHRDLVDPPHRVPERPVVRHEEPRWIAAVDDDRPDVADAGKAYATPRQVDVGDTAGAAAGAAHRRVDGLEARRRGRAAGLAERRDGRGGGLRGAGAVAETVDDEDRDAV